MKRNVHSLVKCLASLVLISSLLINFYYFSSDIAFQRNIASLCRKNNEGGEFYADIHSFHNVVRGASLRMFETGKMDPMPAPSHRGSSLENFRFNFKGWTKNNPFYWWSYGCLSCALLDGASTSTDNHVVSIIDRFYRAHILSEDIKYVEQSPIATACCKLFTLTNNKQYQEYAEKYYEYIKAHDTENGILYSPNYHANLVDGLGMHVPFLAEYSKAFNDSSAYKLAIKQYNIYAVNGVDQVTGLPAHAYRLEPPKIKMGSSNWGRGWSWYAIGLLAINKEDLDTKAKESVDKFEQSILSLYNEKGSFSQFVSQDEDGIDLTATIPLIYYLRMKGLIELQKEDILKYSQYAHEGIFYNSSGDTRWLNKYSEFKGPQPLTQAYMIRLLSLFK